MSELKRKSSLVARDPRCWPCLNLHTSNIKRRTDLAFPHCFLSAGCANRIPECLKVIPWASDPGCYGVLSLPLNSVSGLVPVTRGVCQLVPFRIVC